jgi:hypothetical protein
MYGKIVKPETPVLTLHVTSLHALTKAVLKITEVLFFRLNLG